MHVDKNKCIACGLCVSDCRWRAIKIVDGKADLDETRCAKCGHCIAICPQNAIAGYDQSETKEYDKKTFDIAPETLLNFIKFRRSVRHFKANRISETDLDMLIKAGRFSPTGGNRENVSYIVFEETIQPLRHAIINGLKYLSDNVDKSDNVFVRGYAKWWQKIYSEYQINPLGEDHIFFGAPLVIFVLARETVDGVIASHSIEMMAHSLGLGACYIGAASYVADFPEVTSLLKLPKNRKVAACLAIGYPSVRYHRTVPRKSADIERR